VGSAGILALAAVAGACTLVVELAAVRLMAPWFGASTGEWTNVIGVILLALAVGYLAGARLATRRRPLVSLGLVLCASAAFTAWLPALAGPVCGAFLPEGLALSEAAGVWLWGSLAATLCLFFLPAAMLGCVGPLCVELVAVRQGSHAGSAGGQVLCASTLGSLAGTFATTHWLIPGFGLRWSLGLTAGVLALLAAAALAGARRSGGPRGIGRGSGAPAVALLAVAASGVALGRLRLPTLAEGQTLLAARESAYQSLRVVEDPRWGPMRLLQVNEGLDSFQSVWIPRKGLLGQGFYYDLFALPAWWSGARGAWRVAVLGLGAGTTFRVLEGASPAGVELELWGVEIDPVAVELGREHFELDSEREGVHVLAGVDARVALRRLPRELDLVVLDAYAHQVEIPAHLSTLEFFEEVHGRLAPGGWLAINVGGFGLGDPVAVAIAVTVCRAFTGDVLVLRVPRARNLVLFARKGAELPVPGDRSWTFEGPVGEALLPLLEIPGAWSVWPYDDSATPLTDDKSPMERLQQRSLEEGRARLAASS